MELEVTLRPDLCAVLTGDLIHSTRASPENLRVAFGYLSRTAGEIADWSGESTRFTRYRGDGWQMFIRDPAFSLRAALLQVARLNSNPLALPTRISIGIGRADSLGTADLSDAGGSAFEHSGRALDKMSRTDRLAIAGERVTDLHCAIVELLDERCRKWSREQGEAMESYLFPKDRTLDHIGTTLGISAQAVSYRLQAAGGSVIRSTLNHWERAGFGLCINADGSKGHPDA
jgi:hypothetical protein